MKGFLIFSAALLGLAIVPGPTFGDDISVGESAKLSKFLRAKAMPDGLPREAIAFTGPAGDGRRGSAGFLVDSRKLVKGSGTRFSFSFERAPSGFGFQIIHPHGDGHVLVAVYPSVTLYEGGSWSGIGWGNPATSEKIELSRDAGEILPLEGGRKYDVISQLSADGKYRLLIDDVVICEHTVRRARGLILETPKAKEDGGDGSWIYLGSGWDRTSFVGEGFEPKLKPGFAGLILGPMDGSGPTQNFSEILLAAVDG